MPIELLFALRISFKYFEKQIFNVQTLQSELLAWSKKSVEISIIFIRVKSLKINFDKIARNKSYKIINFLFRFLKTYRLYESNWVSR